MPRKRADMTLGFLRLGFCFSLIYLYFGHGLASYAVYEDAKSNNIRLERTTGMVGLVLMLAFALMLLLPHLFAFGSMESESDILFDSWAVLGLIYFRKLAVS